MNIAFLITYGASLIAVIFLIVLSGLFYVSMMVIEKMD